MIEGMLVTINKDISRTHKHFKSNMDMKSMAGSPKKYKIKKIGTTWDAIPKVELEGMNYIWHPNDLTPVDFKNKKSQLFCFNERELKL